MSPFRGRLRHYSLSLLLYDAFPVLLIGLLVLLITQNLVFLQEVGEQH